MSGTQSPSPTPTPHTSLLPSYSSQRLATSHYPRVDAAQLKRARAIVALALFANVASLLYGALAHPGVRGVARAHHSAFSPNEWFLPAFFALHVGLQAWWALQLFRADEDTAARLDALGYVPVYGLGSVCLLGWTLLWTHARFWPALALAALNLALHAHPVATLPLATRASLGTHLAAKTLAGVLVLVLLETLGAALSVRAPPSVLAKALTGTLFGLACLTTDPIFGYCLVYDLVGLVIGQRGGWRGDLIWLTVAVGAVATAKFAVYRVY